MCVNPKFISILKRALRSFSLVVFSVLTTRVGAAEIWVSVVFINTEDLWGKRGLLQNGNIRFDVRYLTAILSYLLSICGKLNILVAAILIAVKGVYNDTCTVREWVRFKTVAVYSVSFRFKTVRCFGFAIYHFLMGVMYDFHAGFEVHTLATEEYKCVLTLCTIAKRYRRSTKRQKRPARLQWRQIPETYTSRICVWHGREKNWIVWGVC